MDPVQTKKIYIDVLVFFKKQLIDTLVDYEVSFCIMIDDADIPSGLQELSSVVVTNINC